MLSRWSIHTGTNPGCNVLASNGTFIAASNDSSVSLWDATTLERIGSIISHTDDVVSMAISANYDLAVAGNNAITLRNTCDVLPTSYYEDIIAHVWNICRWGFVLKGKPLC